MNSRAAPNVPDCQSYPPSSRHLDGAEAHCIRAKGATNSNRASRAEWRPLQPTNAANNDLAPRMKGERSLEEGSLILSICVTRKKLFSGEYTQICRHPKIDRLQNDKAVFELMRNVFEDCKPRWVKICRYIIPFVVTAVCLSTIKFSPGHADVWGTETNTPVSQKAKPRYLCIEVETDKPALDKNFLLSRFNNPKLCENTRSAWFYLPKRTKGLPQMPNPATGLEFLSVAADEHGVEIVTQVSKLGVFCSSALLVFGINALVVGWTGNIAWWAVGASVLTAIAAALGLWA